MVRRWPMFWVVSLAVFSLGIFLFLGPYGRTGVKSLLLVLEVLPDPPLRPLAGVTGTPSLEQVEYQERGRGFRATVYRPNNAGRHGAVILSLGVNPDYSDPTFLRLVNGLARLGAAVMVPEPVLLDQGKIGMEDVEALVAAFQYLRQQPYVDRERLGYAGFCVGGSLVSIAASDPRIAANVRFLSLLGPYYDIFSLMDAINSRSFQYDGADRPWQPEGMVEEVFARHLIDSLENTEERSLLEKRFVTKETAGIPSNRLSKRGEEIFSVLSREDPSKLENVISNFPTAYRSEMEQLSPKRAVGNLRAKKVFILHDRNDSYVPFVESRHLFESLDQNTRGRSHYTDSELFQHMHPKRSVDRLTYGKELAKLYRHLYLVLLEVM